MINYIYTGGYSSYDGSVNMIDGYLKSLTNAKLVLTGNIPTYLKMRISNVKNIDAVGFVSKAHLIELIINSDVCLCPRGIDEKDTITTYPSKTLKYMKLKKNIVCVNYPGIPRSLLPLLTILPDNSVTQWQNYFQSTAGSTSFCASIVSYDHLNETNPELLLNFLFDS